MSFNMKQNYSLDIITSLFHEYSPEKEIISYTLCDGGIENSNFLIETKDDKYILKIFEATRNTNEVIQAEIDIMIYLRTR